MQPLNKSHNLINLFPGHRRNRYIFIIYKAISFLHSRSLRLFVKNIPSDGQTYAVYLIQSFLKNNNGAGISILHAVPGIFRFCLICRIASCIILPCRTAVYGILSPAVLHRRTGNHTKGKMKTNNSASLTNFIIASNLFLLKGNVKYSFGDMIF